MDLSYVIVLYVFFFIITVYVFLRLRIKLGSSILIAAILGQLFVNILKPPQDINTDEGQLSSPLLFYLTIQFLTPLVAMIYALTYAFRDKLPDGQHY